MALPQKLRSWRPDPLITLILLAVALAIIFPARGDFAEGFSVATKIAIGLLFFLYGARLSPQEALQGLKNWRLHSTILGFTYLIFPLIGLALYPIQGLIGRELYLGLLFMTLVPSTVQSSVAFTSIARGNVAGAIVSASASNIVGVVATPLLVMMLMQSDQLTISGSVFGDIALQLLLPFILGQLLRRWVGDIAKNKLTKHVDRLSIAMVVYAAFSDGIVQGIWTRISPWQILLLVLLSIALVEFLLWLSGVVAKKLGFSYGDRVAVQFCGSKKSLATGLPMAAVIFGGGAVGALILPLMIFHQVQLMICAAKAARWGRQVEAS
ncbi:MAG: bile acid:sodium symporter family protein [Rothia sp. (in: high G+C Gram-positive bacteria)]|uniref:bile acid:sodium symporter family protein n=1 Tax=Rothia sp. (in: high G+C Gram-positive bacteria) TaxID=1885016 RepID=UPI0026F6684A|nr:bile acid:sodium symporter family protein [Rothia sp. (in: high G+C Gram-positive bacteria)]